MQPNPKHLTLKALVERVPVDATYTYTPDDLRRRQIALIARDCPRVLAVSDSLRNEYALFAPGQLVTMDVYPAERVDFIDDLCDPKNLQPNAYDAVVCLAVLEHVYDPFGAVKTLHMTVKKGGYCFVYVPFLYRYHAPSDNHYQDYYRYTRDGLAYLFRDFSAVTLYPVRGQYSTMLNLLPFWKRKGERFNRFADRVGKRLFGDQRAALQASGYYVWAVK